MIRVLLAGAGRAGLVHARNFAAGIHGARLAAVADPDPATLARAGSALGCERLLPDPVAAATDDGIDAVVIAAPTFAHADIAVAALEAGRHVLCEKPLAATLADARRIAKAADASGAAFLMGFMRRFDTGFRGAAARIAAGDIGQPLLIRSTGRGPGLPPEWAWDRSRSGGLIAEVNSHDIDTVRWLSGQEFVRVQAAGRAAKRPDVRERYPGFVDLVAVLAELSEGALAQIDGACPADYGYDARVEVYGSEGVVFAGDIATGTTRVVRNGHVSVDAVRSWRDVFAEAYRAEDAHLVAVARGEEEPRTSALDGLRALEAVMAVNEALDSGTSVEVRR